jgi:hypothetical protein
VAKFKAKIEQTWCTTENEDGCAFPYQKAHKAIRYVTCYCRSFNEAHQFMVEYSEHMFPDGHTIRIISLEWVE